MELKIINTNEDKTNEIYSSTDCQQLINSMDEYYPKIGFNKLWVGYFVFNNNQVVGTGGFTGQPKDGKVEIAYFSAVAPVRSSAVKEPDIWVFDREILL